MKSTWKGSIAFGLVNIPVRLYSAAESQSLASHMLHKNDLSRIRFQRVAESTGKEVPAEEIVKGYEVEKTPFRERRATLRAARRSGVHGGARNNPDHEFSIWKLRSPGFRDSLTSPIVDDSAD
jgi:Ku70/Ku80 beta-barrel domain